MLFAGGIYILRSSYAVHCPSDTFDNFSLVMPIGVGSISNNLD